MKKTILLTLVAVLAALYFLGMLHPDVEGQINHLVDQGKVFFQEWKPSGMTPQPPKAEGSDGVADPANDTSPEVNPPESP